MHAAYAGQSDVDPLHAGCTSIVKYALNEHVHSRRILPSSFSTYIHRSPASTNQTVSEYLSVRQTSWKPQNDAHYALWLKLVSANVLGLVRFTSLLENN